MSRFASHFTVLAASVLVPLAAGCSRTDRPSTAGDATTGSTTVSTDAATPPSTATTPSTSTGT